MPEATYRIPGIRDRVACFGAECAWRPCLWVDTPRGAPGPRCVRRDSPGCPAPMPAVDPERARCCVAPDFPAPGAVPAVASKCRTCGKRAEGIVLGLRRMLKATHEGCTCSHEPAGGTWTGVVAVEGEASAWRCDRCRLWWDHPPRPFERGQDVEAFRSARFKAWMDRSSAERASARPPHPKIAAAQARLGGGP